MKRIIVAVGLSLLASHAFGEVRTEAAKKDGSIYIRSDFGTNRFLIRKVDLSSSALGNNVVNFAGARIVSSSGDVSFDRGYPVSRERDDISPMRFNGTYIGANHGAYVGVKVATSEAIEVGSAWVDEAGSIFRVVSSAEGSATLLSEEVGQAGGWGFKLAAVGELKEVGGARSIQSAGQSQAQVYPAVRRVSMSAGAGFFKPINDKFRQVPNVKISEIYDVLSPVPNHPPVARVSIRYTFTGNETRVQTTVKALDDLRDFSMTGTQAGPLNFQNTNLLQRVEGADQFATWTDITDLAQPVRAESPQLRSSQKVAWGTYKFGQSIGVDSVTINGRPTTPTHRVDISMARKQYPVAVEGIDLRKGDVVKVNAYREYWPGVEPPSRP